LALFAAIRMEVDSIAERFGVRASEVIGAAAEINIHRFPPQTLEFRVSRRSDLNYALSLPT